MNILLIFVDGVGIGQRDSKVNPFAALAESGKTILGRFHDELDELDAPDDSEQPGNSAIRPLPDGSGFFRAVDACMGVAGLPQSATGQATILTGVNVPAAVGRHVSGVPGPSVRAIIEEHSLFRRLDEAGRSATFANAYRQRFFKSSRPRRSATTVAVQAAGLPLRTLEDLEAHQAVFHDYTLRTLPLYDGPVMPERTAAEAAATLARLAGENEFVLHEHFLTDVAAHRGTPEEQLEAAWRIEVLLEETARALDGTGTLLLVISDHGNLEDATHRKHTLAPVPLIARGPGAKQVTGEVARLDDLAPAILRALGSPVPESRA